MRRKTAAIVKDRAVRAVAAALFTASSVLVLVHRADDWPAALVLAVVAVVTLWSACAS